MRGNLNDVIQRIRARIQLEKGSNRNSKLLVLLDLVEDDNNNSCNCTLNPTSSSAPLIGQYHHGCIYCCLKKIVFNTTIATETLCDDEVYNDHTANGVDGVNINEYRSNEELYPYSSSDDIDNIDSGGDTGRLLSTTAGSPTLTRNKRVMNFELSSRAE